MDFSVSPFFDDYQNNAKPDNYYRILFIPGNAVQARELTQIQSMLQEQVKRQGDSLFKNGTVVIPGHVFYDNTIVALKLNSTYGSTSSDAVGASLIGTNILGSSGVSASVVYFTPSTSSDPSTLFVKYNGANGTVTTFSPGEVISQSTLGIALQIESSNAAITPSSICRISEGVYYVNGFFVGVNAQTIVLDKYDSTPTLSVGLEFVENVVTASQDPNLFDNALGTQNYAAPGASRYQIVLNLVTRNYDYSNPSGQALVTFIPLLKVQNGNIQYLLQDTQYSQIESMLARRTHDEAGDYIVKPFIITVKNYRNNNRGTWTASTPYLTGDIVSYNGLFYTALNNGYSGTTAPTNTYGTISDGGIYWLQTNSPVYNNGLLNLTSTNLQDHINAETQVSIRSTAGKAYVQGFEVNVQSSQSTLGYKARDTEQKTGVQLYTPTGSYIQVNTVTGSINTSTMTQVNLVNASSTVIGTAYATHMEYVSGTIGTTGAIYNLYLIDIKLNAGYSFYDSVATIASTTGGLFSSAVVTTPVQLSGFVSVASTTTAIVTGKGTLFTQELKDGDTVQINGTSAIVLSIQSDVQLTLTANFGTIVTNVPIFSLESILNYVGSYIQKFPHSFIQSVRTSAGAIDTSYTSYRTLTFTAASTGYSYTLSTAGESFAGTTGHILTDTTSETIINTSYSLSGDALTLTMTGLTTGHSYSLSALIINSGSGAKEKVKTLTTRTIIIYNGIITDDLGNSITSTGLYPNYAATNIYLTKADVQKIIQIKMSGPTSGTYAASGETDVTSWFKLIQNANEEFYDISYITKVAGIVTAPLKIIFQYFEHSSGDYFSVNSYSSVPYNQIPIEVHGTNTYSLRDCLDFRNKISDDRTGFTNSGSNVGSPLSDTNVLSTSYSFYLPRVDVVSLTPAGLLEYIEGTSSENPTAPLVTDNSLQLAVLTLDPYTIDPAGVSINVATTPHKRYTMADIADIDQRLSNVEYYVSLNLLEQKTSSLQIFDSNGLSRYKNGFIADPFNNTLVGDVNSPDFRVSIDTLNQECRPLVKISDVNLVETTGTTDSSRNANGYKVTNGFVTLPYTESALISQTLATTTQNINPFVAFNWHGVLSITPQRDYWFDSAVYTFTTNTYTTTTNFKWNNFAFWDGGAEWLTGSTSKTITNK